MECLAVGSACAQGHSPTRAQLLKLPFEGYHEQTDWRRQHLGQQRSVADTAHRATGYGLMAVLGWRGTLWIRHRQSETTPFGHCAIPPHMKRNTSRVGLLPRFACVAHVYRYRDRAFQLLLPVCVTQLELPFEEYTPALRGERTPARVQEPREFLLEILAMLEKLRIHAREIATFCIRAYEMGPFRNTPAPSIAMQGRTRMRQLLSFSFLQHASNSPSTRCAAWQSSRQEPPTQALWLWLLGLKLCTALLYSPPRGTRRPASAEPTFRQAVTKRSAHVPSFQTRPRHLVEFA